MPLTLYSIFSKEALHDFHELFEAGLILGIKIVELVAVYIENQGYSAVFKSRHYNFRFGVGGTGNVAGKLLHIGHQDRFAAGVAGAAHPFVKVNSGTGNWPLERS